jgi:outer membrane murein-binding lipoprotein Lpp
MTEVAHRDEPEHKRPTKRAMRIGIGAATLASSIIAGGVSIVVARITTGAKFDQELKETREALRDYKTQVASLQTQVAALGRNVRTISNSAEEASSRVDAIGKKVDNIEQRTRSLINVPVASYVIGQQIRFPYAEMTRVNFDTRVFSRSIEVQTGKMWQLRVPAEGQYRVEVSLFSDMPANFHIIVKTTHETVLDTPPITDPRSSITQIETNGIVYLRKGELLWVEASHSQHANFITGGRFSLIFLPNPP